jgi:hypothetical protein
MGRQDYVSQNICRTARLLSCICIRLCVCMLSCICIWRSVDCMRVHKRSPGSCGYRPLFQTPFDGTVVAFFGSFIVIVGCAARALFPDFPPDSYQNHCFCCEFGLHFSRCVILSKSL